MTTSDNERRSFAEARQMDKAWKLILTLQWLHPELDRQGLQLTLDYFDDASWDGLRVAASEKYTKINPTTSDTSCTVSRTVKGMVRNLINTRVSTAAVGEDVFG